MKGRKKGRSTRKAKKINPLLKINCKPKTGDQSDSTVVFTLSIRLLPFLQLPYHSHATSPSHLLASLVISRSPGFVVLCTCSAVQRCCAARDCVHGGQQRPPRTQKHAISIVPGTKTTHYFAIQNQYWIL